MYDASQLVDWCSGINRHSREDACVPDYSCCNNKVKTPWRIKERFLVAYSEDDDRTVRAMKSMFMSIASYPKIILTEHDHNTYQ